jgi:excinuclease ABC subunit A
MENILIKGAREHNLKNIDLTLPRNKLIVFTGISGSGKSTLAFDTIFAEGQRRYLESLSSYARQFLGQMKKPDVDYISGLSPAISIDQKAASHNPRSTVGTVTEIHDYLRLLYAKIGIPHCPICGREIKRLSLDEIVERIYDIKLETEIEILSPVVRGRKGEYSSLLREMFDRGFGTAYVDQKKVDLGNRASREGVKLARYKKHNIDILADKLKINENNFSRIFESVESALKLSDGIVKIKCLEKGMGPRVRGDDSFVSSVARATETNTIIFNQNLACPIHEIEFPELEPRLFSFNSPYGACPTCEGLGTKKEIDPDLVIPDQNKTIAEGGIMPWSYKKNNYQGTILRAVTGYYNIPENGRIADLSDFQKNALLYGEDSPADIPVKFYSKTGSVWRFNLHWRGIAGFLEDRYFKTQSDAVRADIEKYMSQKPCSTCHGSRYKKESMLVTVHDKNIHEISSLNISGSLEFVRNLDLTEKEKIIAQRILAEIQNRLGFLENVGLSYLTLARSANTLAGGETQRIRLASQIGSQLVGVLYVLDEPSIGLHARDNKKLLETLIKLRDLGNSLIVIEHDEETIRAADYIVDIGPGAGRLGGEIVAEGNANAIMKSSKSITGKYLKGELQIKLPPVRRTVKNKKLVSIKNATEHNLKNLNVSFPLKVFTCVTGVSGSGKSTLVEEILFKALSAKIMRSLEKPGRHQEITGAEHIRKVIMIDQSPIGRTPRSNPATYTGLFTPVRKIFSLSKEAKTRGYLPGRFSFNVSGGRCENCRGEGFLKVEMQFMPDVYLPCDVCHGKRYNSETLQVKYKGKNIADVLEMTVGDAKEFFANFPEIFEPLKVLEEVGLGYINLGQAATTLSGGEAQRIKLASELSRPRSVDTLYILDEPTTGLHFDDIKKLLAVLNRLVDAGNTVVVIEHNLDVVKTADWIIDLGPEGGEGGGRLVASGTPEDVARYDESYTGKFLSNIINK